MVRVKTFTSSLEIFQTKQQLVNLDEQVNKFIEENGIENVISVSDTCTADDTGRTIGIIRTVTYKA